MPPLVFISVNAIVWGAGMMLFPTPSVVIMIMALSSALLIGYWLTRPTQLRIIQSSHTTTITKLMIWVFVLCVIGSGYFVFGSRGVQQLWASGNFGERPDNRIAIARVIPIDGDGSGLLVEFRVQYQQVANPTVQITTDPPQTTRLLLIMCFLVKRGCAPFLLIYQLPVLLV